MPGPGSRKLLAMAVWAVGTYAAATAQQPLEKQLAPYKKEAGTKPADEQLVAQMRDGKYRLEKPTAADRAALKAKADFLVYRVTWPEFHVVLNEGAELKARPNDKNVGELINELRKWLITPEKTPKPTLDQQAYIREFGAELDTSILTVLADRNPPPLIRISAMRLLVAAAESGAPAHWRTVHKMLKDPKTPPDLLIYAVRAAEMLLASYDPTRVGWISGTPNAANDETIVVEIVRALEDIVTKGPPVLDLVYSAGEGEATLATDPKKPADPAKKTPEQLAVWQVYRLQAVKALARLNLEIVGGRAGGFEARPLFTLARVAVSDPALQPPPSAKEIGEAVLGLANVVPGKNVNADEAVYAVATGLRGFALPKATNADDNSAAWKGLAARMAAALPAWRDGLQKAAVPPAAAKKAAAELVKLADDNITGPILKGAGGRPNALGLDGFLTANPAANNHELYSDKPGSKLAYPGGK